MCSRFRSLLIILFLSSEILSIPLDYSNKINLGTSLEKLANACGDIFVSSLIRNKTKDCSVDVPPYKQNQFMCLLFYDINSQLCQSTYRYKLNETKFLQNMEKKENLESFCNTTVNWNFSDFDLFPDYKRYTEKLRLPSFCYNVCGSDDIDNEYVNYFCLYFNEGTKQLKAFNGTATASSSTFVANSASSQNINQLETGEFGKNIISETDALHGNIKQTISSTLKVPAEAGNEILNDLSKVKNEDQDSVEKTSKIEKTLSNLNVPNNATKFQFEQPVLPNIKPSLDNVKNTGNEQTETKNGDNALKMIPEEDGNSIKMPPVKSQPDGDNQDLDGDKDGLSDIQGGDDEDDLMEGEVETKDNVDKIKTLKVIEKPETSFNRDIVQNDLFPNTIPEGFSEENDQFIPVFISAMIMAVLFYIIYHNKSKLGKIFFGLLLEGRRSGRRRGSRGHAYRRLDTLEQALTASATAPPTKVIF